MDKKKNKELLYATHGSDKTPLYIGEVEIPAYVLNNGMRVFSQNGMQKALGYFGTAGNWLPNFITRKQISPYISSGLIEALSNRVEFRRSGEGGSVSTTYGYDATVLIDICDAIIEAKNSGNLSENYHVYADQAQTIIRSVAKVGIIALIDEATGYQHDREKDELQKILKAYISEELLPWQKRFPDIYYKELFRLNGWDFDVKGVKKRPGVIGKWTNTLIYEQLPKDILEELKRKTPKTPAGNYAARFHQSLTLDIGEPNLTAQIQQIITLCQLSDNMKHMWQQFEKLKHRQSGQLELPFNFDEKGHTIAPDEKPLDEPKLSAFNQSLKKAIDNGKGTK